MKGEPMTRFRPIQSLALVATLSLAAPALRAEEKPMAPPKPAPEMSQLAYFHGTWACTGKAFKTPMGPEHPTEATVHASPQLGGFWYVLHYDEKKTAANPMPYHAGIFWGFDEALKTFVLRCQDSFGGYCAETGKGWEGDKFVLEGPAGGMGPFKASRDIFTKKSATEVVHAGEAQGPDGTWMKMDEETCKKAGAKK
jgi:hypothetical protein